MLASRSLALFAALSVGILNGQGTMHRQVPTSETRDSDGTFKDASEPKGEQSFHGVAAVMDGASPTQFVEIVAQCPNIWRTMAITDVKGKYSFSFNPNQMTDAALQGCSLQASVIGYRSSSVEMKGDTRAAITLQPFSADGKGLHSQAEGKEYEKALSAAAKHDWTKATEILLRVASGSNKSAASMLNLGVLQQLQGQNRDAEKSFLESAQLDPDFAVPLVLAAQLEIVLSDFNAAAIHSEKAIQINRSAFPDAYAVNALANAILQKAESAEKSAREGLRLDSGHQLPELEYALGMALYAKDEKDGAREHFRRYLALAPSGPNAVTAKRVLEEEIQGATSAADRSKDKAVDMPAHNSVESATADPTPTLSAVQLANAALLKKAPSETCLESISQSQIDERGKVRKGELVRADIAVSDGHEIYGEADGKRFQDQHQWDVLGYGFSTTGLFNSMSRALMAGNQLEIRPAGRDDGTAREQTYRYAFRTVPGAAEWAIRYGKEFGHAGEQGWFLVDRKTLLLRTVFVRTADLPSNLKFNRLDALIEYEVETVNGERTLLPSAAKVELVERSGAKRMAQISFDHCRQFGAESTVSSSETSASGSAHLERPRLPAEIQVLIALNEQVDVAMPESNGVVTGRVLKQITVNGRVLIPEGAAVEGHVRPRRDGTGIWLEFDRVQTRRGWAPFYAELITLGVHSGASVDKRDSPVVGSSWIEPLPVPGVASISFANAGSVLAAGTQMIWRTESLSTSIKGERSPQMETQIGLR